MPLIDKLTAIANAIRGKTGKEDSLTLEQMVTEIEDIELQSKTVTPTDAEQTITADDGYFGLASVIVEAAEGGGSNLMAGYFDFVISSNKIAIGGILEEKLAE